MYIIDRIEENRIVVCEEYGSGKIIYLDKSKLPQNAREGSVLEYTEEAYVLNEETANARKEDLSKRMKNLFKR